MSTDTFSFPSQTDVYPPDQWICWMGLSMHVPGGWQIRQHGISPEAGRLVFVDRRMQRMEVFWSRPAKEPDPARMIRHTVESMQEEHPDVHVSSRLPGGIPGWDGFSFDQNPRCFRAVRYDADAQVLLQVTLTLDGIREDTNRQTRTILNGLSVAEHPDRASHWRAFGMDCRLPPGWALRGAKVHPMDVTLRFEVNPNRKRRSADPGTVTIRRLGMAGDWFDGDLEAYARRRTTGLRSRIGMDESCSGGCRVVTRVRKSGAAGVLRLKGSETLKIWHDPETNSLFELTVSAAACAETLLPQIEVRGVPGWFAVAAPAQVPVAATGPDVEQDRLVEGIPVRNAAVIEEPAASGAVLRVPLRPRWWTRGWVRWFFPFRDTRAFGVDAFGAEVWSDCDGTRTVESICERFARRHSVSYDEAKAAVYQFLQTLTQRELILIQLSQTRMDA